MLKFLQDRGILFRPQCVLVPETENSALSVNTMQHLILIDSFLLAMEEQEEELEEDADYIPSNASLVEYSKQEWKVIEVQEMWYAVM